MFHRLLPACLLSLGLLGSVAGPAAAADRRVQIVNNTGFTMVEFYGSNKGSQSWEEDILGQDVLEDGQSVVINFNDESGYCKFDFRAVFEDGDEVVEAGVNVCEIGSFTFE